MDNVLDIIAWCGIVGVCICYYWQYFFTHYGARYVWARHMVGRPMIDEQQLAGILQSDMKLWEMAEKSVNDKGQLSVKTELPHGIGPFEITFTGVENAIQRRAAAEQWAANIRGAVDDVIGEDSVTARAQQAAARAGGDSDQLHVAGGANPEGSTKVSDSQAVQTHEEKLNALGEDPANRLDGLRRLVNEYSYCISSMQQEIKALQAYVEVMNAYKENEGCDTGRVEATCDAKP